MTYHTWQNVDFNAWEELASFPGPREGAVSGLGMRLGRNKFTCSFCLHSLNV